jgi:hypothetical protein
MMTNEVPWGVPIDAKRWQAHGITAQIRRKGGSWFGIRVFAYGDLVMETKVQGLSDAVKRMNAIVETRLSRQRERALMYASVAGRA